MSATQRRVWLFAGIFSATLISRATLAAESDGDSVTSRVFSRSGRHHASVAAAVLIDDAAGPIGYAFGSYAYAPSEELALRLTAGLSASASRGTESVDGDVDAQVVVQTRPRGAFAAVLEYSPIYGRWFLGESLLYQTTSFELGLGGVILSREADELVLLPAMTAGVAQTFRISQSFSLGFFARDYIYFERLDAGGPPPRLETGLLRNQFIVGLEMSVLSRTASTSEARIGHALAERHQSRPSASGGVRSWLMGSAAVFALAAGAGAVLMNEEADDLDLRRERALEVGVQLDSLSDASRTAKIVSLTLALLSAASASAALGLVLVD